MARFNDKLAIFLSVATLLFILGAYITDSYLWGAVFALLGVLATLLLAKVLPKRQKGIALSQFTAMLLLEGKALSTAYLYRLYPPREPDVDETETGDNDGNGHSDAPPKDTASDAPPIDTASDAPPIDTASSASPDAYFDRDGRYVVNALGYAKAGEEWAAKIYRTLKPRKVPLVVATMDIDRKALATLGLVASGVKILRPKELLRRLRQAGVYPTYERPKTRLSLKAYLAGLSYRHAYLFALSAAGCTLFSLFLPIKIYYYVFAIVNALLALAVVLAKRLIKD